MAENTIDKLDIEIATSADESVKGIDKLIASIKRLDNANSGFGSGLKKIHDKISNFVDGIYKKIDKANRIAFLYDKTKSFSAVGDIMKKQDAYFKQIAGTGSSGGGMNQYNDTVKQATKNTVTLGNTFNNVVKRTSSGLGKIGNIFKRVFVISALYRFANMLRKGIWEGIENIAKGTERANKVMSEYASSFLYLKNSVGAAVYPILENLMPLITNIVDKMADLFNMAGAVIARLTGGSATYIKAKKVQVDYADSINDTATAIDNMTASFDRLNIIGKESKKPSGLNYADMFEEVEIPQNALKAIDELKEKLEPLKNIFDGLKEVFDGFMSAVKSFYDTYLYNWLVNIGNWMKANPDTLRKIGEGLAFVAGALLMYKGLNFIAEITGIGSLLSALGKWLFGTKNITDAMKQKNKTLQDQTRETQLETEAVLQSVPAYGMAANAVMAFGSALSGLELPDILKNPIPSPTFEPAIAPAFDLTEFNSAKNRYQQIVQPPTFNLANAPELGLSEFNNSILKYQTKITAPEIDAANVPNINLTEFNKSVLYYQTKITAPEIEPVVTPELDIDKKFKPSLRNAETTLSEAYEKFKSKTVDMKDNVTENHSSLSDIVKDKINILGTFMSDTFEKSYGSIKDNTKIWKDNITTNAKETYDYIKTNAEPALKEVANSFAKNWNNNSKVVHEAVSNIGTNVKEVFDYIGDTSTKGLNSAGKNIASWAQGTWDNFAKWANGVGDATYKGMKNLLSTVGNALESAWGGIVDFFSMIGETISGWWNGKSTMDKVLTVALPVAVAGAIVATVLTGGAAAPAFVAAAPALIPAFAKGGIISKPTYGLLGEYPNANSNPEIVTPQNIMYNTVVAANAEIVVAFNSIANRIIAAIENKELDIVLGDDEIARSAKRGNERMTRLTGK